MRSRQTPNRRAGSRTVSFGRKFTMAMLRVVSPLLLGLAPLLACDDLLKRALSDDRGQGVSSSTTWPTPRRFRAELRIDAAYDGVSALEEKPARPVSLASGDFDGDGLVDLAVGYERAGQGLIAIHTGSPDFDFIGVRRHNGSVSDFSTPFLRNARVLSVPDAPDFLVTGDFDGDGVRDIVSARRGGARLFLISGSGDGGFHPARAIPLSGRLTGLISADLNRPDGLTDLAVSVESKFSARLLVFEGPSGALTMPPEEIILPAEALAMAAGRFSDGNYVDLAVSCGKNLVLVRGRDRRISWSGQSGASSDPVIEEEELPFDAVSIAGGGFSGGPLSEIALVSSSGSLYLRRGGSTEVDLLNVSDSAPERRGGGKASRGLEVAAVDRGRLDELVLLDRESPRIRIISFEAAESGPAPDDESAGSRKAGAETRLNVAEISSPGDGLPLAVLPVRLGGTARSDFVVLSEGSSSPTLLLTGFENTFTVTNTNDEGEGSLRQAIIDANDSPGLDLIDFQLEGSGPHTISPLSELPAISDPDGVTIDGYTQEGSAANTLMVGNNALPMMEIEGSAAGEFSNGLLITDGINAIRGLVINRFGGSAIRYFVFDQLPGLIEGNFLGTDTGGVQALPNRVGISIFGGGFIDIGGTAPGSRNLISGNSASGVSGLFTIGLSVKGNYIGVDRNGAGDLGNSVGFSVDESGVNRVGGIDPGAGNVISGNTALGIALLDSFGDLIQGNLIGVSATGDAAIANGEGIRGVKCQGVTVGGATSPARNVISGNEMFGVLFEQGSGNQIQGNLIGTDATGTANLGNRDVGIVLISDATGVIGGATPGAGNVVSANLGDGLFVLAQGCVIRGNLIGVDLTGSAPLGNGRNGVVVFESNQVSHNVISSNAMNGILSFGGNQIRSNMVGTDGSGAVGLGNSENGIVCADGSDLIEDNLIAFNLGAGVAVAADAQSGNSIRSNSIFGNLSLGIDLGADGVTQNDPCDADSGPNDLQNYPEVILAIAAGGSTTVHGVIHSTAGAVITIQVFANTDCDPSGHGQGKTLVGVTTVTVGANCAAGYSISIPTHLPGGGWITATATNANGSTSEFSMCSMVVSPSGALEGLIAEVESLVARGRLSSVYLNMLTIRLRMAITEIDRGNIRNAGNQIRAFITQTQTLSRTGKLAATDSRFLVDYANAILARL